MSARVYWEPVSSKRNEVGSEELVSALQRCERGGEPMVFDSDGSDEVYLTALEDAGIDGAKELKEALSECGSIRIYTPGC